MATAKKKTNYIGYDLEWLEKRCQQLKEWCEKKLDGGIIDRIEIYETPRGAPIIKLIASEETQIKTLRDTLKELPSMLLEINRLRKIAEEEETGDSKVRGDHSVPGFMDDDEEEVPVEKPKKKGSSKKQKESPKALPAPAKTSANEDDFEELEPGDFEDP